MRTESLGPVRTQREGPPPDTGQAAEQDESRAVQPDLSRASNPDPARSGRTDTGALEPGDGVLAVEEPGPGDASLGVEEPGPDDGVLAVEEPETGVDLSAPSADRPEPVGLQSSEDGQRVSGLGTLTPGKGQLTEGDGPKVKTPLGQLAWSDLDRAVRSAQHAEPEPGTRAKPGKQAHTEPNAAGGLQVLLAGDGPVVANGPELVPGEAFLADVGRQALAWAQRRSLGLSSACGISVALAACAATWFSAGTRADNFRGVAALGAGYLVLLAGKSLARSSDPASGAADNTRWLATLGACLAECAIYAGLAAGAAAEHWPGTWTLGIAVLGLVSVRDLMTTCSNPPGLDSRSDTLVQSLARAVLTMPPGGRVLLIMLTAPAWGARVALLALLDWAIISVGYGIAGRAVPALEEDPAKLVRLRDDGAIARAFGMLVRGQLLPLPPAILGVAGVATLVMLGLHGLPSILIVGPAIVMLLAAPGSSNRHSGRFDWLVPIVLLGAQMLYVAAAGLATGVPGPVIFLLCGALLLRYADLAFPGRPVMLAPPRQPGSDLAERGTGLGWEGRLLLVGVAAALGIATYAYIALTAYLGLLLVAKAATSCLQSRDDSAS